MKGTGKYPANWKEIADKVKAKSMWKCEACGCMHDPKSGHTLTVHHLDGNKSNCNYTNLVALCQRCHLRVQAEYAYGQQFLTPAPWWAQIRCLDTFDLEQMAVLNKCSGLPKPVWS